MRPASIARPTSSSARIASLSRQRMIELRIDQLRLAEQAAVSPQTVRDLQRGLEKAYHPRTLTKVAQALEWPIDALPRLLTGMPVG